MMAETKRDPSIGKAWMAWYALQGDEPLDCVSEFLGEAQSRLGEYIHRNQTGMAADDNEFLSGLNLVLIALASAAGNDGDTAYRIDFKRSKRGKPINKHDRALLGHRAASLVESLVDQGIKQESAIAEAEAETGLSRAEIYSWLRHRRNWRDAAQPGQIDE